MGVKRYVIGHNGDCVTYLIVGVGGIIVDYELGWASQAVQFHTKECAQLCAERIAARMNEGKQDGELHAATAVTEVLAELAEPDHSAYNAVGSGAFVLANATWRPWRGLYAEFSCWIAGEPEVRLCGVALFEPSKIRRVLRLIPSGPDGSPRGVWLEK